MHEIVVTSDHAVDEGQPLSTHVFILMFAGTAPAKNASPAPGGLGGSQTSIAV
jgi:hypothetical protein